VKFIHTSRGGPRGPMVNMPMSVSSYVRLTLVDCRKYFAVCYGGGRSEFIKWKPQITVLFQSYGVILLTYLRAPWRHWPGGPVGHCTSGSPLNPPLSVCVCLSLLLWSQFWMEF